MISILKWSISDLFKDSLPSVDDSSNSPGLAPLNNDQASKVSHKRFLSGSKQRVSEYLEAARAYPQKLPRGSIGYLYHKPYDQRTGHGDFFLNMHNILGLIKAMSLPPNADILEVGCGPGWVTETLALLGYRVTAFDPSDDLIEIARDRLRYAAAARKLPEITNNVNFIVNTLEDLDFPEASFDAIIFYDILHHIIDEDKGLENCSKWIRDNGSLGIIEGAWVPGNLALERALEEEMEIYGTLESPFTREYLDELLAKHGFTEIERLVGVNGFFPISACDLSVRNLMSQDPASRNDLIARKTGQVYSSKSEANTEVKLTITATSFYSTNAQLRIILENIGETTLLGGTSNKPGLITLALRRCDISDENFSEALNRITLPNDVPPGQKLELTANFRLPTDSADGWILDVVAEHICWLSSRGSAPVHL